MTIPTHKFANRQSLLFHRRDVSVPLECPFFEQPNGSLKPVLQVVATPPVFAFGREIFCTLGPLDRRSGQCISHLYQAALFLRVNRHETRRAKCPILSSLPASRWCCPSSSFLIKEARRLKTAGSILILLPCTRILEGKRTRSSHLYCTSHLRCQPVSSRQTNQPVVRQASSYSSAPRFIAGRFAFQTLPSNNI